MRQIKIGFISIFLILLFLPLIFLDYKSNISRHEKRNLADRPLFTKNNKLNPLFFAEFDTYVSDRFGFRNNLLRINNKVNGYMGQQSTKVLVGKSGWLFYIDPVDGNLLDYFKQNLMTEEDLTAISEGIRSRKEWCEENNIKFIFMIAPNKHNIYSEYYPYVRPEGISRTEQIVAALEKNAVKCIYPRDLLIAKKHAQQLPVYYKLDTHWNDLGAYFVYKEELHPQIKAMFPQVPTVESEYKYSVETVNIGRQDLVQMLNLGGTHAQPMIKFTASGGCLTESYSVIKGAERYIETRSNLPRPLHIIVFRDSFFESIEPFLSSEFGHVKYNWRIFSEKDKDYVLKNKPDLVILEIQERYVPQLIGARFNK